MNIKEKLCILYDGSDNKYVKEANQIKIIYHKTSKNFEKFIETNQNKTIYIEIKKEDFELETLKRIQGIKEYQNWILQLPIDLILTEEKKVDNNKFLAIKDCCNYYMFLDLIGNWEILQFVLTLNPKEVYLTNLLCFQLEDAKKICDKHNVGIRLIPNLAQSAWNDSPNLTKFFIRPEDIEIYEPFVSGFDFYGENVIQEICYEWYVKGYWFGDLQEIIENFNTHLDSRRLPPDFGEYRLKCKKRCMTGSSCHLCQRMKDFSDKLEDMGMQILPKAKMNKKMYTRGENENG